MSKTKTIARILLALGIVAISSLVAMAANEVTGPENVNAVDQVTVEESGVSQAQEQTQDVTAIVANKKQRPNSGSFSKTFAGIGAIRNYGDYVIPTKDKGYLEIGYASKMPYGGFDVLIVKTDKYGNEIWQSVILKEHDNLVYSVAQRKDGGYVIVGTTDDASMIFKGWIVNVDKNGVKESEQIIGSRLKSISPTSDDGFIVAGNCFKPCLIKLDQKGQEVWNQSYNSTYGFGIAVSAKEISGGGYIFAVNGNFPITEVITTDSKGKEIGRRTFNDNVKVLSGTAADITPISDVGGYALVGHYSIEDQSQAAGYRIVGWVITVNSVGKSRTKTYEADNVSTAFVSVQPIPGGGLILAGNEWPKQKGLAIRVAPNGNQVWRRTYEYEGATSFFQSVSLTDDGGFIYGGYTIGANSFSKFLMVKTRANGK